jgi:hypothetical protein
MSEYYGEFSDSHAKQLQEDPNVEVLEIEDGEYGVDKGTKFVKLQISK